MLRIKLAKSLGFCSGVSRAINIAEIILNKQKGKVYSLGSIIHNQEEINRLKAKGLINVKSLDEVENHSCVILPSHGSPRFIINAARKKNLKLVDVTCPYVSHVHKICKKLFLDKFTVIIIGDSHHPEVKALIDLAPGAVIIESPRDISANQFSAKKIGIISQTTQSKEKFFNIVGLILKKNHDIQEVHIFNTICLDTSHRQEEVKQLAKAVDRLVVIGSRSSANTKRLLALGRRVNNKTYLAEKDNAALLGHLKGAEEIGVISGASAPRWLVDRIIKKIKEQKK
jgi:(E)-4-hydroxy-3-methyl-but-2-enyl pyrophosphate reductase